MLYFRVFRLEVLVKNVKLLGMSCNRLALQEQIRSLLGPQLAEFRSVCGKRCIAVTRFSLFRFQAFDSNRNGCGVTSESDREASNIQQPHRVSRDILIFWRFGTKRRPVFG